MELNVLRIALPIALVGDHASLSEAILNSRNKKMAGQHLLNHALQCQLIPNFGNDQKMDNACRWERGPSVFCVFVVHHLFINYIGYLI